MINICHCSLKFLPVWWVLVISWYCLILDMSLSIFFFLYLCHLCELPIHILCHFSFGLTFSYPSWRALNNILNSKSLSLSTVISTLNVLLFIFLLLFIIIIIFFLKINLFIYLFLAVLGRCCAWAFSSCGEQGPLFVAVRGLLIVVASLVAEHGLQACGLQ